MAKILAVLAACFFLFRSVLAWNAEGHMVVAQIAYNHLQPAVKTKCDSLIAVPLTYGSSANSNFITAACWADDYKSSLGTAIWHYLDLPFSLDGTPTSGVATASFDVVQAINLCISNLQSSSVTRTGQATSLRYLLHFVGDIQQPLHCSTAVSASYPGGDAGGNSFSITGTWINLHSLWDAGGGYLNDSLSRPLSTSSQSTLNAKVAAIEADYPFTANVGFVPDPMDWAEEGLSLAQSVSYVGINRGSSPSTAYLNGAKATTEQRMAAGGQRLANLFNTLFSTNPITLGSLTFTNARLSFSWSAIPGRTYHIQWKQELRDAAWTDLTNIIASSNSASFTEMGAQTQRFYRVVQ